MDDGVDPVLSDQFGDARLISSVANQERRARRHRPIETGREIVEHHHPLASVDERMDHVAADIAGTAGDQDCHAVGPPNPTPMQKPFRILVFAPMASRRAPGTTKA